MVKMRIYNSILLVGLLAGTFSCSGSSKKTDEPIELTPYKTGQNKFVLTHMNGKLLDKNAEFRIHENQWELDMRNGDKIYFNIISKDEMDPLCGLKTVDSFKDTCEICATVEENKASVNLIYAKGTMTYEGYFDK